MNVTPGPVLVGHDATDDGVSGGLEVPGGMGVLRRLATTDVAALEAHTKVDPDVAEGHALETTLVGGVGQFGYVPKVFADFAGHADTIGRDPMGGRWAAEHSLTTSNLLGCQQAPPSGGACATPSS